MPWRWLAVTGRLRQPQLHVDRLTIQRSCDVVAGGVLSTHCELRVDHHHLLSKVPRTADSSLLMMCVGPWVWLQRRWLPCESIIDCRAGVGTEQLRHRLLHYGFHRSARIRDRRLLGRCYCWRRPHGSGRPCGNPCVGAGSRRPAAANHRPVLACLDHFIRSFMDSSATSAPALAPRHRHRLCRLHGADVVDLPSHRPMCTLSDCLVRELSLLNG